MIDVSLENLERVKQWLRDHDDGHPDFSYYQSLSVVLERLLPSSWPVERRAGRDENEHGAEKPSWEERLELVIDALGDVRPFVQGDGPRAMFGAGIELLKRATGAGRWQDRVQDMIEQLAEIREHQLA